MYNLGSGTSVMCSILFEFGSQKYFLTEDQRERARHNPLGPADAADHAEVHSRISCHNSIAYPGRGVNCEYLAGRATDSLGAEKCVQVNVCL